MRYATSIELHGSRIQSNRNGAIRHEPLRHLSFILGQVHCSFHTNMALGFVKMTFLFPSFVWIFILILQSSYLLNSPENTSSCYIENYNFYNPFVTYLYALSGSPPLQPESKVSQSTSSCSENSCKFPFLMAFNPSIFPITLNAQHDPHDP